MSEVAEFEAAARTLAQEFTHAEGLPEGALDFSKDSLAHLEAYLLSLRERAAQVGPEELRELAIGAGAYLAEVVRRRAPVALRWVPASVLPGASDRDNPFLLATPKNLVFAVLGKPHRLLAHGAGESVVSFADAVQQLCSREATSLG